MSEVGTQKDRLSTPLVERVQAVRLICRQIRISKGRAVTGRQKSRKQLISRCQENPLARPEVPVPQTDTGR